MKSLPCLIILSSLIVILISSLIFSISAHPSRRSSFQDDDNESIASMTASNDKIARKHKPARNLVRPLWMDPKDTFRALVQNNERTDRRIKRKRRNRLRRLWTQLLIEQRRISKSQRHGPKALFPPTCIAYMSYILSDHNEL